ncbi:MAG: hypothetical protein LUI85_11395 [Bacteroides sp.]|nr:hypothetical protein [Bacteroides sp.]
MRQRTCGCRQLHPNKKGADIGVSYYIRFLDLLWEKLTEEEFRKTAAEGVEAYIRCKRKQEAMAEEVYKLEKLEERMRENKDIL